MKRLWITLSLLLVAALPALSQDPGWIGVTVVDEAGGGTRIQSVQNDSPAARAGLQSNDILTEYNDQTVMGVLQLTRLVQETPVGRTVDVKIRRGNDTRTLKVTTDRTPDPVHVFTGLNAIRVPNLSDVQTRVFTTPGLTRLSQAASMSGVSVVSLTPQLREFFGVTGTRGVLVESVEAGSGAARGGVQAGDVITSVDGMAVSSPAEFTMRMRSAGSSVNVEVVRDKKARTLSLEGLPGR